MFKVIGAIYDFVGLNFTNEVLTVKKYLLNPKRKKRAMLEENFCILLLSDNITSEVKMNILLNCRCGLLLFSLILSFFITIISSKI